MIRLAACAILGFLIGMSASAQSPRTGAIVGSVRYLGKVPEPKRVALSDGQTLLHSDIVVHPKTKGLRDVAVMLEWKGKVPADEKAKPILIDQRDMIFTPRVVTVQEGIKVRFENNDLSNHGVSGQSTVSENSFNITTPAGQAYEHKFKAQKNPIPIGCALHAWMQAHVFVMPHPYHAVTDTDGRFRIENVPVGKHTLLLVHPDTNYRESITVEVQADKTAEVAIEWKVLKK